ncbi:cation:proton antiporter [Robbsia sp. KACC 23696]|uniref:cation:proton antiporter n=1 Tax=Robbsia sp. KACC 23696 TaxID=3149231 RepID=UPI00325B6CB0
MDEMLWFLVVGCVLIFMGIANTAFKHLPVTSAMAYLAIGVAVGPIGLHLLEVNANHNTALLRQITEVAMLVSLFAIGLRVRLPPTDRLWMLPLRLGIVAMLFTILLVAAGGIFLLHLTLGQAILLAAILAPTDPVLAHEVQISAPGDVDLLRFSLTGEGGLNDGIALPFALLGIAVCNYEAVPTQVLSWHFAGAAIWGTVGALLVGWSLGELAVRVIVWLRTRHGMALGPEGFYALGLIALSYGLAELAHTYAFLAVFAAGLALRRVEHQASGDKSVNESLGSIKTDNISETAADPQRAHAYVAERVLGFTVELERIAEAVVMVMIGSAIVTVWPDILKWQTVVVVVLLFLIARPLAVFLSLLGSPATRAQRYLIGWLGIRGVGSFYYLLYAQEHVPKVATLLNPIVMGVIVASVVLHGVTSTPLMKIYRRP